MSYYQAPPDRIDWLERERVPCDQWPLLFETARAGNASLERVWEIRSQHPSWYDVLQALNVPSSYFYYDVPAETRFGPPFGKAYGYYRTNPSKIVRWSDSDLIRLASVRYLSESSHRSPQDAVEVYQSHPHFIKRAAVNRNSANETYHKPKVQSKSKPQKKSDNKNSQKHKANKLEKKHQDKGKDHAKKHEDQGHGNKHKGKH